MCIFKKQWKRQNIICIILKIVSFFISFSSSFHHMQLLILWVSHLFIIKLKEIHILKNENKKYFHKLNIWLGVYMDRVNPLDPVKPTQSNPKKWFGSGNWVDIVSKTKKPTQKIGLWAKPDPNPKTHLTRFWVFFFYRNPKSFPAF
jgi:hypothetical protein